ncbi:urate oxidase, partial [Lecanoromycetidae sp. Uapishka_2]
MPQVSAAQYGKDNIRVYKVFKDEQTGFQNVVEMTVCVLLKGDIETSYTEANNKVVVATDTMKQTVYIMAKQHSVTPPELFASIIASHFIETYAHIHSAKVAVKVHRWTRLSVNGEPHPHSFFRDGAETRNIQAIANRDKGITVRSCIAGLLVLKSTGSAFHDFYRNEYTLLQDTYDRILSTEVDCGLVWNTFANLKEVESAVPKFDKAWEAARKITLETFATENSPSVQNTLYKMCEQILAAVPEIEAVDYSLPNKHYFEIDLSWHKGLKNTGKDAEVYAPQSDPNGLIQCTVSR